MQNTIYFQAISLGCPKNRVETEQLLGSLSGIELIPAQESETGTPLGPVDFILINTCGFIQPAIEESVQTIVQSIADLDSHNHRPLLVVAGCLVGRFGMSQMQPDLPEVDLWLDNHDLENWSAKLSQALGLAAPKKNRLRTTTSYAWLKISDGCEHNCSFCTIPQIRGPLHSYPAPELVAEAKGLLDQGVKELVLVAQDLLAWGKDLSLSLPHLLDQLLPLTGLSRLRLLYLYPAGLTPSFLNYLQDCQGPLLPYFDIPLQHSHPEILSHMGRPFSQNSRQIIDRVRHYFPQAALRTSLIVGFPGETPTQFEDLLNFVQEIKFQHLGVFSYEAEAGTKAAEMPQQIKAKEKNYRKEQIMQLQAEISSQWLTQFSYTNQEILVDAESPEWPGLHLGRTWFQAPEIDGITYVSGPGVQVGSLINAEITETRTYDLVALA